jgi:hypothetical protein
VSSVKTGLFDSIRVIASSVARVTTSNADEGNPDSLSWKQLTNGPESGDPSLSDRWVPARLAVGEWNAGRRQGVAFEDGRSAGGVQVSGHLQRLSDIPARRTAQKLSKGKQQKYRLSEDSAVRRQHRPWGSRENRHRGNEPAFACGVPVRPDKMEENG